MEDWLNQKRHLQIYFKNARLRSRGTRDVAATRVSFRSTRVPYSERGPAFSVLREKKSPQEDGNQPSLCCLCWVDQI